MSAAIEADHLRKVYRLGKKRPRNASTEFVPWRRRRSTDRHVVALDDVSLEVSRGEALGIIGPNGAGKSTLLRIFGRVTLPTSGRAVIGGRVIPMLELGGALQPDATARENVFLNAALFGIPRAVVQRRMPQIVEFAGLEEFIDVPVKRFSSGMHLRLAFSMAINMEPDVILADEILAVGDIAFQEQCIRRVETVGETGTSVLFVSHDMNAIKRICHRVIWLDKGRVVADGPADAVVERYQDTAWREVSAATGAEEAGALGSLRQARLVGPEGDEVAAVDVSRACSVVIPFETFEPDVEIRCVIAVDANGVDAFQSPQPTPFTIAKPGIYEVACNIPPNLLSDLVYSVKIGVSMRRGTIAENVARRSALTFRAFEPLAERGVRGTYDGPLRGVVRPKLMWSEPERASRG